MAYGSVRYFPDHEPAFNYTSMYVAYYNGITKFEIIKVCRYSILIKMVAIKEMFKRFYPKLSWPSHQGPYFLRAFYIVQV